MYALLPFLTRYAKTKCQALEFGLVYYDISVFKDIRIAHIDNVLVLTSSNNCTHVYTNSGVSRS